MRKEWISGGKTSLLSAFSDESPNRMFKEASFASLRSGK